MKLWTHAVLSAIAAVATTLVEPSLAQPSSTAAKKAVITPDIPQTEIRRSIFSGKESRIAAMNYVNMDCSSGPLPDIRVVTAPSSGEVRFDPIKFAVDRKQNNSRVHCNGKIVDAVGIFYKSRQDFIGRDNVILDVDFKDGHVRRFTYSIIVR